MSRAIGILETYGLLSAIGGLDAALKAADVAVRSFNHVSGGVIAWIIEGEAREVRVAISVGKAAASRLGDVVSDHVIAQPVKGLVKTILPPKTPGGRKGGIGINIREDPDYSHSGKACSVAELPRVTSLAAVRVQMNASGKAGTKKADANKANMTAAYGRAGMTPEHEQARLTPVHEQAGESNRVQAEETIPGVPLERAGVTPAHERAGMMSTYGQAGESNKAQAGETIPGVPLERVGQTVAHERAGQTVVHERAGMMSAYGQAGESNKALAGETIPGVPLERAYVSNRGHENGANPAVLKGMKHAETGGDETYTREGLTAMGIYDLRALARRTEGILLKRVEIRDAKKSVLIERVLEAQNNAVRVYE